MVDQVTYLLACVAEECNETAQRIEKAIRFGLFEVQPGQDLNNWQRLSAEYNDLINSFTVLCELNSLIFTQHGLDEKRAKILEYMKHAQLVGQVEK